MLNGKKSSLKNTKRINVRYLFLKDVINRGEMLVEYFPTEEIWVGVLTKPLKGKSYRVMISKLTNMPKLYVKLGDNEPEKGIKTTRVSANKKKVEFNRDVHVKCNPRLQE